jgi:hypothetical protein
MSEDFHGESNYYHELELLDDDEPDKLMVLQRGEGMAENVIKYCKRIYKYMMIDKFISFS